MVKCFNSSKFNLRFLHPLQALFPTLKIDIFCRIIPLSFIKNSSKFNLKFLRPCKCCDPLWKLLEKFLDPANVVSLFENCHFLSHRPPIFHKKLIKIQPEIFGPLQTLFPSLKIDIFCCIVHLFFIKNMK